MTQYILTTFPLKTTNVLYVQIMRETLLQALTGSAPDARKAEPICRTSSYTSLYVFQIYGPIYKQEQETIYLIFMTCTMLHNKMNFI